MKSKIKHLLQQSINKVSSLNNNDIYDITGVISVLTAFLGVFGLVFGNTMFLVLSPLILLVSYHCNFLMDSKI